MWFRPKAGRGTTWNSTLMFRCNRGTVETRTEVNVGEGELDAKEGPATINPTHEWVEEQVAAFVEDVLRHA